jgi:hypothetical protein
MKLIRVLIVSCLGLLYGCWEKPSLDDDLSTVPVTNNPYIAPDIMKAGTGPVPF